ncbi:hypothetical protein [Lactobacillus johnsonii]|uniref:Uncharacterized protein n=1 Tax=Lactobacillus johnsonii TaxID=33959 RepID=A0A9X0SCN7_LACJH|nr:hypothetical protein [Lactobacillus johnsonii]KXN76887.1 hypothetical protein AYJ53_07425 [Lactobacillus johnsonii]
MKPIEKEELKKWIKQEQDNSQAFYSENIREYWGNFVLSRVESGEVTTLKQAKFLGRALWVFYDNALYIKDHE